ncbi:hypothetical protein M5689_019445 [Euphorbia peplus]|nr:hypothetical protein M5689_019445 [Euphorbia peplus]
MQEIGFPSPSTPQRHPEAGSSQISFAMIDRSVIPLVVNLDSIPPRPSTLLLIADSMVLPAATESPLLHALHDPDFLNELLRVAKWGFSNPRYTT